jgi:methionyl-tRNA synthetase
MVRKYCNHNVPNCTTEDLSKDHPLKAIALPLGEQVKQHYQVLAFNRACEAILNLVRASNKFIDEQAPWTLYKQGQQHDVERVLYAVLESVRLAAYLLSPVIPNISNEIYKQLGFAIDFNDKAQISVTAPFSVHTNWGILSQKQQLGKPQPVFQRLELLETV